MLENRGWRWSRGVRSIPPAITHLNVLFLLSSSAPCSSSLQKCSQLGVFLSDTFCVLPFSPNIIIYNNFSSITTACIVLKNRKTKFRDRIFFSYMPSASRENRGKGIYIRRWSCGGHKKMFIDITLAYLGKMTRPREKNRAI